MKLLTAILGGQLLFAAAAIATPKASVGNGRLNLPNSIGHTNRAGFAVMARSAAPEPVPGCIKQRGTDEDALNICCLKLKRDAEVAADNSADSTRRYEKAMAVRERLGDLVARDALPEALPGCIKERGTDEDALNICCLKLKREAEAAASAAADAYSSYAKMLEYRSL